MKLRKKIAFLGILMGLVLPILNTKGAVTINGDTPWVISSKDYETPAIQLAIRDAEKDWYKVFGYPPVIFSDNTRRAWTEPVVVFGSVANTKTIIKAEVPEGKEQHRLYIGKANHNQAVISVGTDVRGVVYGIYTFCERVLGIDPMYVFTDNKPEKKKEISVGKEQFYTSKKPTFEYRGWFINDEELHDGLHRDPLGGNVISMEWMNKILETLLRCKNNMIVPESAQYPDATVYDMCQRRGVVVSHHHVTPVGLNMMNWPKEVPFSFVTHKEILIDAWRKAVKAQAGKEIAWVVGFRGKSDGAFWHSDPAAPKDDQGRADVISDAIQAQVDIIREQDPDATIVAALWNEQSKFYNAGLLRIPEGVCKMFSDDGRGFMRDEGGKFLEPGDGLYYHVMMMMNTQNRTTEAVPPSRFYKELRRYVEKGATKYAIINTSGIRPAAMSVNAISDFLWDADTALSTTPEKAMDEYLNKWHERTFHVKSGAQLTALRKKYYNIPYMRDKMPVQGRWKGARAEHLLQFQIQDMLKNYSKKIEKGTDLSKNKEFAKRMREATEPLAETAEFFPSLWKMVKDVEKTIPADRKDFYQAYFTYQVAVHMYSARALKIVTDAFSDYSKAPDAQAFANAIEPALDEMEKIYTEAHKAEYGIWDTMFMHVRLMDLWKTRLQIKETIARIRKQPYTSKYRGYYNGAFWKSAHAYMDYAKGQFPYFYKETGPGLDVLNK